MRNPSGVRLSLVEAIALSLLPEPSRIRASAIGVACVLFCLTTPAHAWAQDAATRVTASVTDIAAADTNAARREAIVAQLRAAGVEPVLESFGEGTRAGTNIVVTLPERGTKTLVVGAHYDRVNAGRGAVDNGAACAALIELVARFKVSPLNRVTLQVAFFDREEVGLQGSRAFFAVAGRRVDHALNLDIFAYGDTIFATASHLEGVLLKSLRSAAMTTGLPVRDVPIRSYPASDHVSMMAAEIETIGLALVDAADVDGVLAIGPAGLKPGTGPRILTIIHTPKDTMAEVRPEQMTRGIALVEQLIRQVDSGD